MGQVVSGDSLYLFDPRGAYLPSGSGASGARAESGSSPVGKANLLVNSELPKRFPDQLAPLELFGFHPSRSFSGTILRLPLSRAGTYRCLAPSLAACRCLAPSLVAPPSFVACRHAPLPCNVLFPSCRLPLSPSSVAFPCLIPCCLPSSVVPLFVSPCRLPVSSSLVVSPRHLSLSSSLVPFPCRLQLSSCLVACRN